MAYQEMIGIGARDDTGKAFASVNRNIKGTTENAKKLDGSLRIMRGGMGQLGHQVQDVAVQLQMGQNALMVFTQQGAQVASLFGPTGAIIGALGAVAGALAAALVPDLMNATDKVQDLRNATKELSDLFRKDASTGAIIFAGKLKEVAKFSEAGAENLIDMANEEALKKQRQLRQELDDLAQSVLTLGENARGVTQESAAASILGISVDQYKELAAQVKLLGTEQGMTNEEFALYLNNLAKNKRAGQEQRNQLDELRDSFNASNIALSKLNSELEQFSNAEYGEDVDNVGSSFETLKNKIERSFDKIQKLSPSQILAKELQKSTNITFEQRRALAELIAELSALEYQEMFAARAAEDLAREQRNAGKEARQAAKDFKFLMSISNIIGSFNEGLDADLAKIKQNNEAKLEAMRQSFMSEKELLGVQEAEKREFINSLADTYFNEEFTRQDALTQLQKHFADKRTKISEEEAEKKRQIQQMGMDVIANSLNFMASNFEEGTALQKAAFLASKGFAASQAIIAANLAAAQALTMQPPGPQNIAFANLVRGMGYANAAMIMAQAVASFEGGGFTGRGARSGGLDGRGGFLSLLHPNETIVDHTKGQGQGITIINNVDATGAGPEVEMKIKRAMQEASTKTLASVQDLMRRRRLA